ncbi:hypothetical protein JCM8547_008726 [Rhodosporidiobolus lusitaniae]
MSPVAVSSPASPGLIASHPLKPAPPVHVEIVEFKQTTEGLDENPLNRIWRGDEEGKIKVEVVPNFKGDLYAQRQWVKEHMAGALQYWGKLGYGEGVAGHITVRDPVYPDHYWMNSFAMHYSLCSVSNLILVTPEGRPHPDGAQMPINQAGYLIHSAIHNARPEINAIAHCHSMNGKAWSVFGKPIDQLVQDSAFFYDNLAVYPKFGGIVLAADEGANIAKAMGPKNKTAILQNHGLLTLGDTVDECVYYFALLDRLCGMQLMVEAAEANGLKKVVIDDEDAAFTAATLQNPETVALQFQVEYNLLVEEKGHKFLK